MSTEYQALVSSAAAEFGHEPVEQEGEPIFGADPVFRVPEKPAKPGAEYSISADGEIKWKDDCDK